MSTQRQLHHGIGADGYPEPPTAEELRALQAAGLVTGEEAVVGLTRRGLAVLQAYAARRQEAARVVPHWDEQQGTLSWRGEVIRRLSRRAAVQRLILAVFEEDGWPEGSVDDPLPGKDDVVRRDRLREGVRNLNEGLPPGTIRFHTDGSGQGIWWEPAEAEDSELPQFAHCQANGEQG